MVAGSGRLPYLECYADAILKSLQHLKLGSLDSDWYERRMRVDSVYVPQSVTPGLPPRDLTRDYLKDGDRYQGAEADNDAISLPLLKVARDPAMARLIFLGDPGVGKSTVLKYLALEWAKNPATPLVLFIELRLASGAAGTGFLDYLEKGASPICRLPRLELHQHLGEHASLVLFDGLDEVSEPRRTQAVADIIRFVDDYPRARVLVTTRITGYHPGSPHPEAFRDAGFQQFTIQDFDDPKIDQFIERWHHHAFVTSDERERYGQRLREAVADSVGMRELAANPLLLTMMAIFSPNQPLPRNRGKLYERCAEILLDGWELEKFPHRKQRGDASDVIDKLGSQQKICILGRVAEEMQKEGTGPQRHQIGERKLKEIVRGELTRLGVEFPWVVADDFVAKLCERNFMLAYLGHRRYAFIHRTFLDYFCACDIKYRLEDASSLTLADVRAIFQERWRRDEWHEVLRLLCGIIDAELAGQCVAELLAQESKFAGGHDAVLLASECLREISVVGMLGEVQGAAREALLRIWEAGCGGLSGIRVLHEEEERVRARVVKEISRGWNENSDTLSFLKDHAMLGESPTVRQTAFQELARGWRDDPDTLRLVKDRATNDEDHDVRRTALQQLAHGWKTDPRTVAFLKERATRDEHYEVRWDAVQQLLTMGCNHDPSIVPLLKDCIERNETWAIGHAAVKELVRSWRDSPDTLTFLKDLAGRDRDEDQHEHWDEFRQGLVEEVARGWKNSTTLSWLKDLAASVDNGCVGQTAVDEMLRCWKDDLDTLPFLKQLAANARDEWVRNVAVRELAEGWKDDPDTLPLLKDRATRDDKEWVRDAAVEALAEGWKDDPDTLPLLKNRATRDDSDWVRKAAVEALAEGWKDDPDTLPLLKDRATRDESERVRTATIRELTRGWNFDPRCSAS